jgi:transposase
MASLNKPKLSALGSINKIQKAFGVSFSGVARTFSFGLKPTKEEETKLDKWFSDVNAYKKLLYESIYKDLKTDTKKYFEREFTYDTFFKGGNKIDYAKSDVIGSEPIIEGLRIEIGGSINSFKSNFTGQSLTTNKSTAQKDFKRVDKNQEIIQDVDKERLFNFAIHHLQDKLQEYISAGIDEITKKYQTYRNYRKLVEDVNNQISGYNYNINRVIPQSKQSESLTLDYLKRPTSFPVVEKELNKAADEEIGREALKKLLELAQEQVDQQLIKNWIDRWSKKEARIPNNKPKNFERRLAYWARQQPLNGKLSATIQKTIDKRLQTLKEHIGVKKYDASGFNDYLNLLALRARLANSGKDALINERKGHIRGSTLRGQIEKEVITIPGFSWKTGPRGKPLKNVAFAKKIDKNGKIRLYLCMASSASAFKLQENGDLLFIKTTGGSRKRALKVAKSIEYVPGVFDTAGEGAPLLIPLHFGKSQARKYILNQQFGVFSKAPKIFLNNGKIKRIKVNPGDEWQYFFDITVSSDKKVFGFIEYENSIKNRAETVIGLDRGEVVPIAYAVINKKGDLLQSGILGKVSYIKLLGEYRNRIEAYQRACKKIPKSLRGKISRLQKTTLETAISEILRLAAENISFIAIENLSRSFKGAERHRIPKKTYKVVEKILVNALNFAGLVRIPPKPKGNKKYWGNLTLVNAAGTSQACPKCGKQWDSKFYDDIFKYSKDQKFKNIDFQQAILEYKNQPFSLNPKWERYSLKEKLSQKESLKTLRSAIKENSGNLETVFKYAIKHRPTQDTFICHSCGYEENADIVGAINIARRGLEQLNSKRLTKP